MEGPRLFYPGPPTLVRPWFYLEVCTVRVARAVVLLLDRAATATLTSLRQTHTLLKGRALRCERSSRNAERHGQRQHKRHNQQRDALAHMVSSLPSPHVQVCFASEHPFATSCRDSSSPPTPQQTKTGRPLRRVAGCATGSARPINRRPS
jgi:hypothetical protein